MSTVIVACKIPNGLNLGDGVIVAGPKPITPAEIGQLAPEQYRAIMASRPGGYQITRDVPAVVWDLWFANNSGSDMVRNKMIFASASETDVFAFAFRNARTRSGLEQGNPQGFRL